MPGCAGGSVLDVDAVPKSDAALDLRGRGFRVGVVPSWGLVLHAVDGDMEIVGIALPRTNRSVIAGLQEFLFDTFGREIAVALDNDSGVAFRDDFSGPGSLGHFCAPPAQKNCVPSEYRRADGFALTLRCTGGQNRLRNPTQRKKAWALKRRNTYRQGFAGRATGGCFNQARPQRERYERTR